MSNCIEKGNKIAFHPGYYIKELVESLELTQEDFAKRLDTTPKNLSLLIRGEQSLSIDMAMKLSRMLGTSVSYWLNLQSAYDELVAEFKSEDVLQDEKHTFIALSYKYFKDNFGLPNLPRKIDEQIAQVRQFLGVATLCVLENRDMAVSFRSAIPELTNHNTIKANAMVQIATNVAMKQDAPRYNKEKLLKAVEYALTLTTQHQTFYPLLRKAFIEAGVVLVVLPNLPGSNINGANKRVGDKIMLMVNDRRMNSDTFWFTLLHEIGHIINGDYGISFDKEKGKIEEEADRFAEDALIDPALYREFVAGGRFDCNAILAFAERINRAPGIVVGRLENDGIVEYNKWELKPLRCQYKVC